MSILGPRHALSLILLLLPAWRAAADSVPLDPAGWPIWRELLLHRWDKTKAVEMFWAKPEGNGPFPAILFIHGHQEPPSPGASVYARAGRPGADGTARLCGGCAVAAGLRQFRRTA
jgi:hypothetical protein